MQGFYLQLAYVYTNPYYLNRPIAQKFATKLPDLEGLIGAPPVPIRIKGNEKTYVAWILNFPLDPDEFPIDGIPIDEDINPVPQYSRKSIVTKFQ